MGYSSCPAFCEGPVRGPVASCLERNSQAWEGPLSWPGRCSHVLPGEAGGQGAGAGPAWAQLCARTTAPLKPRGARASLTAPGKGRTGCH